MRHQLGIAASCLARDRAESSPPRKWQSNEKPRAPSRSTVPGSALVLMEFSPRSR